MLLEIINDQGFCKAICKYISIADLFNHNFAIINHFSDIMVLNIDEFGLGLNLAIFDDSFVITI